MAKDRRLYAKFDINMDEHAKVIMLSDEAFRALFESTFYARRQLTDGFLDERIVLRKWGEKVALELSSNDPHKPSWAKVEGGWQIHDFGEHQTTTADIQAKREAGRLGGLAKASKALAGATADAKHLPSNTLAKTETETETNTPFPTSEPNPPLEDEKKPRKKPSTKIPDNWQPTEEHAKRARAKNLNVNELAEHFKLHAETHDRRAANWNSAFTMWITKAQPRQATAWG